MQNKLAKFSNFAKELYPHETEYLMTIQKFEKGVNYDILKTLHQNTHFPKNYHHYNPNIDKRSYSYLKSWIENALSKADVDIFHNWLLQTESLILNDNISPKEEKEILSRIRTTEPSNYYFLRFYEVLQHFRDYLLIRLRSTIYKPTNDYLQRYQENYKTSIEVNNQLNQATEQIIQQHEQLNAEPIYFSDFLLTTFYNDSLDGYTRYKAAVRLTYLYYNYRDFENLRSIYDELDKIFKTDRFYSKRLLSNYYANRTMMHSKLKELDLAEQYGYLSIKRKNSDYLFYLANLCGVLLRNNKKEQALELMNQSVPELKHTGSFYNKIGFASFYTRTLLANHLVKNAVDYASTFLDAYKKEIFDTRWHLFFSSYYEALLTAEKYSKIVALSSRYNITSMEKKYADKTVYTPILMWYTEVARFMENKITREKLIDILVETASKINLNSYKNSRINEYFNILSAIIPSEINTVKKQLKTI